MPHASRTRPLPVLASYEKYFSTQAKPRRRDVAADASGVVRVRSVQVHKRRQRECRGWGAHSPVLRPSGVMTGVATPDPVLQLTPVGGIYERVLRQIEKPAANRCSGDAHKHVYCIDVLCSLIAGWRGRPEHRGSSW